MTAGEQWWNQHIRLYHTRLQTNFNALEIKVNAFKTKSCSFEKPYSMSLWELLSKAAIKKKRQTDRSGETA